MQFRLARETSRVGFVTPCERSVALVSKGPSIDKCLVPCICKSPVGVLGPRQPPVFEQIARIPFARLDLP